jgi:ParB/RepB/Spo0J family partition protein
MMVEFPHFFSPHLVMHGFTSTLQVLPLSVITADPDQPRHVAQHDLQDQWLLESIQQYGLFVPLSVHRIRDDEYVIVDGHRRYSAALALGIQSVPCQVYPTLRRGDAAVIHYVLHETSKPWNQAELHAWRQKMKRMTDAECAQPI